MQNAKTYLKNKIRWMRNNHPYRYPKWKEEDIVKVLELIEELEKKDKV